MHTDTRRTMTTWVSLSQVRSRARGLSPSTVERYRQWLEEGREARRCASFATATGSSFGMAVTASLPLSPLDTSGSMRRSIG
jgi:hypothetical protein